MSTFTGTSQEFKRYIGPRLRNLVQMLTNKLKATVGACEYCGNGENLESAHIQGKDRNQIIDLLLADISTDSVVTVDLKKFEENFRFEHDPIEKAILILCRQCHRTYDAAIKSPRTADPGLSFVAGHVEHMRPIESARTILPITLEPPQAAEFKRQLLISQQALITAYYNDGRIEDRPWSAGNMTELSNVMGNIRSRYEFRQGVWQSLGLVKVHIRVVAQGSQ